ncbi:Transposase [Shigella dysenteriae 1617]|uniref:Transposase n=1 Tax=Shigella dysenteriae 1617 TaxID=754093 RepID=A0A0A6ZVL9_SHIDY|nr:Transposase [Shigella dysenteriae 1617]
MALICELDEQWSFVLAVKPGQHWLWYAYNT